MSVNVVEIINYNYHSIKHLEMLLQPYLNSYLLIEQLIEGCSKRAYHDVNCMIVGLIQIKNSIKYVRLNEERLLSIVSVMYNQLEIDNLTVQKLVSEIVMAAAMSLYYEKFYYLFSDTIGSPKLRENPMISQILFVRALLKIKMSMVNLPQWDGMSYLVIPVINDSMMDQNDQVRYYALEAISFLCTPLLSSSIYQYYLCGLLDGLFSIFGGETSPNYLMILSVFASILRSLSRLGNTSTQFYYNYNASQETNTYVRGRIFQFVLDLIYTRGPGLSEFEYIEVFDIIFFVLQSERSNVQFNNAQSMAKLEGYLHDSGITLIAGVLLDHELVVAQYLNDAYELQPVLSGVWMFNYKYTYYDKNYIKYLMRLVMMITYYQGVSMLDKSTELLRLVQGRLESGGITGRAEISDFYFDLAYFCQCFKYNNTQFEKGSLEIQRQYFDILEYALQNQAALPPVIVWHLMQVYTQVACYNVCDNVFTMIRVLHKAIMMLSSCRTKTELAELLFLMTENINCILAVSSQVQSSQYEQYIQPVLNLFQDVFSFCLNVNPSFCLYTEVIQFIDVYSYLNSYVDQERTCQVFSETFDRIDINGHNQSYIGDLLTVFNSIYVCGGHITQYSVEKVLYLMLKIIGQTKGDSATFSDYAILQKISNSVEILLSNQYISYLPYNKTVETIFQQLVRQVEVLSDDCCYRVQRALIVIVDYCYFYSQNAIFYVILQLLADLDGNTKFSTFKAALLIMLSLCTDCTVLRAVASSLTLLYRYGLDVEYIELNFDTITVSLLMNLLNQIAFTDGFISTLLGDYGLNIIFDNLLYLVLYMSRDAIMYSDYIKIFRNRLNMCVYPMQCAIYGAETPYQAGTIGRYLYCITQIIYVVETYAACALNYTDTGYAANEVNVEEVLHYLVEQKVLSGKNLQYLVHSLQQESYEQVGNYLLSVQTLR